MSKQSKSPVSVNAHTRRPPTRVVVVATPAPYTPPPPALPCATSPTQQSDYDYYGTERTPDGGRRYRDTIVDRAMHPDDSEHEEY